MDQKVGELSKETLTVSLETCVMIEFQGEREVDYMNFQLKTIFFFILYAQKI